MTGCCCDIKKSKKVVKVEYLYLDINTCERCIGTDTVLENVLKELSGAFKLAGYSIAYKKICASEKLKEFLRRQTAEMLPG